MCCLPLQFFANMTRYTAVLGTYAVSFSPCVSSLETAIFLSACSSPSLSYRISFPQQSHCDFVTLIYIRAIPYPPLTLLSSVLCFTLILRNKYVTVFLKIINNERKEGSGQSFCCVGIKSSALYCSFRASSIDNSQLSTNKMHNTVT
jgi:hypothetical protein